MSEGGKRFRNARVDWRDGAPYSPEFGDVYFSADGAAETEHVFLNGNELASRFARGGLFAIGELGFGTGLNFLKTWALWNATAKRERSRMQFFSIEAYPLAPTDLERAHAAWPKLALLSARLREGLPPAHPGFHRLGLADDVTLLLAYGDAQETLTRAEGGVDAWFLDGFAPSRNPGMWRPEIFAEVARLSRPGATFATFTVAGEVRRALGSAGFSVEKRAGFGRKKEMLAGRIAAPPESSRRAPWFQNANARVLAPGATVAIVGGGVAGASLAYEAVRAGLKPTIFDPEGLAAGASGNPAGLIMPRLDLGNSPGAQCFVAAYLHTIRLLNELRETDSKHFGNPPLPLAGEGLGVRVERARPTPNPFSSSQRQPSPPAPLPQSGRGEQATLFNQCGALLDAPDEEERARQQKILAANLLPDGWLEARESGLFFPLAGTVSPPRFVAALAGETSVVAAKVSRIVDGESPAIVLQDGSHREFDAIIIANGVDALAFEQTRSLPLSPSGGQIDWFPKAPAPPYAIAFGPYAAPAPDGGLVIGATYSKIARGERPEVSTAATEENIAAVARLAPDIIAGLNIDESQPRAAIRCQTPDRLPVAGPLPELGFYGGEYDDLRLGKKRDYPAGEMIPGVHILSGLGSRGLVTAPLAAAMIVAQMTGAPLPVLHEVAEALHPARFFIRDLKKTRMTKP